MTISARTCNTCSACCYTHGIEELAKGNFSVCHHQNPVGGCRIYGEHPRSCQKFTCAWLDNEVGTEHDRPDLMGLVVTGKQIKFTKRDPVILLAFEAWPNSVKEATAQLFLHRLMSQDIALCVMSAITSPRWQYHLYRTPATEAFGERLVASNNAVVWHEPLPQQSHPPG